MFSLLLGAVLAIVPVHGVVVQPLDRSAAIVRTDAVTATRPSSISRYRIEPAQTLSSGTGIDALLDDSSVPPTLRDVVPAGAFSPGLPEAGRVVSLDVGSAMPAATLVDQRGNIVNLERDFRGRTVLLTFIFTRCPDRTLCPAISGKYAYLQRRMDPKRFALVEVSLDPTYDSPTVLRQYAARYGADPAMWTLLTGTGTSVKHVLDRFRISSLRVSSDNFIHNDKLFIVRPDGRIAYVAQTGGWDPEGVLAEARAVSGIGANPFERIKLSLVASVVALCGGSQFAGIVLLELALFALIVTVVAAVLWWVSRVLWARP